MSPADKAPIIKKLPVEKRREVDRIIRAHDYQNIAECIREIKRKLDLDFAIAPLSKYSKDLQQHDSAVVDGIKKSNDEVMFLLDTFSADEDEITAGTVKLLRNMILARVSHLNEHFDPTSEDVLKEIEQVVAISKNLSALVNDSRRTKVQMAKHEPVEKVAAKDVTREFDKMRNKMMDSGDGEAKD